MRSCSDRAWLDQRIQKTRRLIENYEEAIEQLALGEQSYTIDTGQSRQTVTRAQLPSLSQTLSMLENRLATLCARRGGGGSVVIGRPGF